MHAVEYHDLIIDVLQLVNTKSGGLEIIRELLAFFREEIPVDAVAIRLCDGDDYPYFSTDGFPTSFVEAETSLCTRNELLDCSDRVVLECLCGTVICGRGDPDNPLFTANGSFWTNSTTALLSNTDPLDLPVTMRGTCNRAGFESVLLIPIRADNDIIGLLQLNDTRCDRFSPELIDALESICESIGTALLRCRSEEQKRSQIRLETILEMAGATCHEINQPLQVILGNLELLQCNIVPRDDERFDDILQSLYESAQRIRDLSQKLQGMTRYETRPYAGDSRIIDFDRTERMHWPHQLLHWQ